MVFSGTKKMFPAEQNASFFTLHGTGKILECLVGENLFTD